MKRGDTRTKGLMLALGLGMALGACDSDVFVCTSDSDCRDGTWAGVCQPDGWCSFFDDDCSSDQRYGELASEEVAGTCVPTAGSSEDPLEPVSEPGPDLDPQPLAREEEGDTGGSPTDECPDEPDLVLCVSFDALDETTVFDDLNPRINGELVGDAQIANGPLGNVLTLPGADGHITMGDRLDPPGSFSVEAWVQLEANAPGWFGIVDKWWSDEGFWLGGTGQGGGLSFWVDGTNISIASVPAEQWLHVAATFDASSGDMVLYLDGNVVATGNHAGGPVTPTSTSFLVGRSAYDKVSMAGQVDTVRMWSRVLSASEL
ncbi:MAG: LamG domain-containing protein [Nannocystaceae bacterium]